MKTTSMMLAMLLFFCFAAQAQQSYEPRSLKPTNFQKKVTTLISGKSRSYYSLNDQEASLISLRGPGKLRVITRGRFAPDRDEKIAYKVLYSVDGGEQEIVKISGIQQSNEASYKNSELGTPGQLKDFEIDLERGEHSIEFKILSLDIPVAVRYVFTPVKAKKKEWIAFSPSRPSEPVDLISRESTVKYYRFSFEKPLKVVVNGPTELRVLTRIENHYQMRGNIHYRMQVKENNEVINTYQLSSRRSEIAVYKEDNSLIPGKACEFLIDVPKGRHTYEIRPLDKDKERVLGRFLLPLKDVNLVN